MNLLPRLEQEFLPFVEKPIRYLGNELNIVRKDLSAVTLRGVLCFPDVYDIGMSHYGLQVLYHIVNKTPQWTLSRSFHPWIDAEKQLREKNIPLYDLEYFLPLSSADWIGFTLQYELHYTGVVNMLDLGGIPIRRADRADGCPIVIAGGPCTNNPEPLADIIDAFVYGDGEEAIVDICTILEKAKQSGITRTQILAELAKITGVYVPNDSTQLIGGFVVPVCEKPVAARRISALTEGVTPQNPLVPLIGVVHHRLAIEVMRGCTRGCRFCSAGYFYRPVRERPVGQITAQICSGLESTGWDEVGLLSLSTADYSGFNELVKAVAPISAERRLDVSLPSTRIDSLTDEQLGAFASITTSSSFTIAPEAGSERLRAVINKGFSDADIVGMVHRLMAQNIQTLKLYFMVGLPTENDEDIEAIISCVMKISGIVANTSRRRAINVAISPFSPKPGTPFQWEAVTDRQTVIGRCDHIKNALRKCKNVKVSYREPFMSYLETVLSRGDRRIGALIIHAWEKGARLDGWEEHIAPKFWQDAIAEAGIDGALFTSAISTDQPLPWRCITNGISSEWLSTERDRAYAALPTSDCRTGECDTCGICQNLAVAPVLLPPQAVSVAPAVTVSVNSSAKGSFGRTPVRSQQTERYFYRFTYCKEAQSAYLSHLDMVSILQRAALAIRLPLEYSEGFHPHPRISFGPPLPLGVWGEAELFDCVATAAIDGKFDAFNALLPHGLRLVNSLRLNLKPIALNSAITAGQYALVPRNQDSAQTICTAAVARYSQTSTLPVSVKNKEGIPVDKDVYPLIIAPEACVGSFGTELRVILRMQPARTCRVVECIAALFPDYSLADFMVRRVRCLRGDNPPFLAVDG